MNTIARATLPAIIALWAVEASGQTADEIVEKHLAAVGGRAALAKLQTQTATGTISVSMPGMDLSGQVALYAKVPNKSRMFFTLDLSRFGGTDMVVDRRCDGKTAFMSNNVQGDRELTGSELDTLLNAAYPTPLLAYKETGAKIEFLGKEQVGARPAYVLLYTPKAGSPIREYFDAETYLLIRSIEKAPAPEVGGDVESTRELSDYRTVDGVKTAFTVKVVNPMQTVVVILDKVEHNMPLDDAMFVKPPAK